MAEWVNVFALGPCDIEVYIWGELISPAGYAAHGIASVAEVNGAVVMTSNGGMLPFDGLDVRVHPQYSVSGMDVRVRDATHTIETWPGYTVVEKAAVWLGPALVDSQLVGMDGSPVAMMTPDSVQFSPEAWDSAGIRSPRQE